MKKLTKKVALSVALDALTLVADQMTPNADWTFDEVKAKLSEMMVALDKKSTSTKPTKAQQENEGIKAKILAVMDTTPATVSEIMKRDEVLAALSNQKVSALMTQLVNDNMVVKTEEKRKSYFALA